MQVSQNQKYLLKFFLRLRNLDSIQNFFKKSITLIADVFLNLGTPKNVVIYMSEKSDFREPLDK